MSGNHDDNYRPTGDQRRHTARPGRRHHHGQPPTTPVSSSYNNKDRPFYKYQIDRGQTVQEATITTLSAVVPPCSTPPPTVVTDPRAVQNVDIEWECMGCGGRNYSWRERCRGCRRPKEHKINRDATQLPPPPGLDMSQEEPVPRAAAASAAQKDEPEDKEEDWACTQCGQCNFPCRTMCRRCGTRRPPQLKHLVVTL